MDGVSVYAARSLVGGTASGEILLCTSHIPGWGGIDYRTGDIVEIGHPQFGQNFAGRILVMPGAKGASGWSGNFHLARVNGVGPVAVITRDLNTKLAGGLAILGVPALIDVPDDAYREIETGRWATVSDGMLRLGVDADDRPAAQGPVDA